MARPKKGMVLKLPVELTRGIKPKTIGYGLHLIETGRRPENPIPAGNLRNVRIVLSERAQALWDAALPKYRSKAALASTALAVVKELGLPPQSVTII